MPTPLTVSEPLKPRNKLYFICKSFFFFSKQNSALKHRTFTHEQLLTCLKLTVSQVKKICGI